MEIDKNDNFHEFGKENLSEKMCYEIGFKIFIAKKIKNRTASECVPQNFYLYKSSVKGFHHWSAGEKVHHRVVFHDDDDFDDCKNDDEKKENKKMKMLLMENPFSVPSVFCGLK